MELAALHQQQQQRLRQQRQRQDIQMQQLVRHPKLLLMPLLVVLMLRMPQPLEQMRLCQRKQDFLPKELPLLMRLQVLLRLVVEIAECQILYLLLLMRLEMLLPLVAAIAAAVMAAKRLRSSAAITGAVSPLGRRSSNGSKIAQSWPELVELLNVVPSMPE